MFSDGDCIPLWETKYKLSVKRGSKTFHRSIKYLLGHFKTSGDEKHSFPSITHLIWHPMQRLVIRQLRFPPSLKIDF